MDNDKPTLAECCELGECCRCCPNGYGDADKEGCLRLDDLHDDCCICCPDLFG